MNEIEKNKIFLSYFINRTQIKKINDVLLKNNFFLKLRISLTLKLRYKLIYLDIILHKSKKFIKIHVVSIICDN